MLPIMKQFRLRLKWISLMLLALVNFAFASVERPDRCTSNPSAGVFMQPESARPAIKKVFHIKQLMHLLHFKSKKAGGVLVAVVVLLAVLLAATLAFGLFIAAWGGASAGVLALVGAVGLALIIFIAARIIRGIKRKRGTAHLKQDAIEHP